MAINPLSDRPFGIDAPAVGAFAITPSDTVDFTTGVRAITINGVSGTIKFLGWNNVEYTTGVLPSGMTYPLMARRVYATGTTATVMTGWI